MLPVEAALVPEPVADVSLLVPALVEPPAEGEALDVPEMAAEELGEAAADVRGVDVVDAAPSVPKFTEPTASWTLSGGAGMMPLRTCEARPDELVELVPLTLAPAEGATLLAAPVPPTLAGEPLLVVPVFDDAPVPVDVLLLPPVALAMQAALLVPVAVVLGAPGAVELMADGRAEALLSAPVLAGAEAATLVRGTPLAAVLGTAAGAVPVLGPAVPVLPQAASTKEAAASVGKSGLKIMDRFLRVDLAAPGEMLVLTGPARPMQIARTTRAISV